VSDTSLSESSGALVPAPAPVIASPAALPVLVGDLFDTRWPRLVDGWLAHYRAVTATAYKTDLTAWVTWAVAHGLTLVTAGPGDIGAWVRSLEAGGARPAGIARKLAALSSFYTWAVDENAIPRSPIDRVRRPKVIDDAQPLGLDRHQATQLLLHAHTAGPRDHALICLLLLNGLRVSEACSARVEELGTSRGHVTIRITRKGGREAVIPLAPRTADAVAAARAGRITGPLLRDYDGHPLDRHDAARIVRRLARRAGLPPTNPHALRHAFVTAALDTGAPSSGRPRRRRPCRPSHHPALRQPSEISLDAGLAGQEGCRSCGGGAVVHRPWAGSLRSDPV
jgi:integrase/recombinase XerD